MEQDELMECARDCIMAANNLMRLAQGPDIDPQGVAFAKLAYKAQGMVEAVRAFGFYVEFDKTENQYKLELV